MGIALYTPLRARSVKKEGDVTQYPSVAIFFNVASPRLKLFAEASERSTRSGLVFSKRAIPR
jgi:hypothetical protein